VVGATDVVGATGEVGVGGAGAARLGTGGGEAGVEGAGDSSAATGVACPPAGFTLTSGGISSTLIDS